MAVNLSLFAGAGWQFFTNSGTPLSGGLIYTYAAGTTTNQATYTSSSGGTAHPNPIVLDSAGRVPGGEVWLTSTVAYKFVLQTSTGVLIATYDNVGAAVDSASLAAPGGSALIGFIQAGAGAVAETVQSKLRQYISIKDFGAVGDGSTDDTAAIQAAVTACAGSALYVPPCASFYKITSPIVGVSNILILGSGLAGTIRNTTTGVSSDINILQFTDCTGFVIQNLALRGADKAMTGPSQDGSEGTGIAVLNCSNFMLLNNNIQYMTNCGIFIGAQASKTSQNGQIIGNYLNNNGTASTAGANYLTSASVDILMQQQNSGVVTKILIEANICISPNIVGVGTTYYPDYSGSIYDITITGNEIANKAKHGVMFYGGALDSQAAFSSIISNNNIRDCGWIGIYLLYATQDMVVTGNKITNVCTNVPNISLMYAGIGGYSSQSYYGDSLGRGAGLVIANNSIYGFNGWSGIRLTGYNHVVIEGNHIKGDGTAANTAIDPAYTYANNPISLQACTLTKVTGNSVRCTSPGESGSGAIYVGYVGGTVYSYFGNVVANNTVFNANNGIYLEYQTALNCSDNNVYLPTSNAILATNVSSSNIDGNIITRNAVANVPDIRLTPGTSVSVINNKLMGTHATGSGINVEAGSSDCTVASNDLSGLLALSNSAKFTDNGTKTQKFNNKFGLDPLIDGFTMGAATSTTVNNSNAASPGRIILWPLNAAAATLVSGANSPFVSAVVAGTSFTVSTAGGGAAAGTEIFAYQMVL